MKLHLLVTSEHIRRGRRGIRSCPIALCLREALEPLGYMYVSVGHTSIGALKSRGPDAVTRLRMTPSELMLNFIQRFDAGETVTPINFEVVL